MSTTLALGAVAVVAILTYAMRAGLILALADATLPPWLLRALRYVAPAVLTALVVSLVTDPDAPNRGVTAAEVAGLLVAGSVAWRTGNLIATLVAGMGVFWLVLAMG